MRRNQPGTSETVTVQFFAADWGANPGYQWTSGDAEFTFPDGSSTVVQFAPAETGPKAVGVRWQWLRPCPVTSASPHN